MGADHLDLVERGDELVGDLPTSSSACRPTASQSAPPVKHCWYDGPYGRQAALLLEWRGRGGLFPGRIAVAALEPDGWAIVEMWVEQGMLSAVG